METSSETSSGGFVASLLGERVTERGVLPGGLTTPETRVANMPPYTTKNELRQRNSTAARVTGLPATTDRAQEVMGEVAPEDPYGAEADIKHFNTNPASRDNRILCCQLFVNVITTACMLTILVFLAQDSHTLDVMAKRVEVYMDTIEQSQILTLPKLIHDEYVNSWGPALNTTAATAVTATNFVTTTIAELQEEQVLLQIHQALLEGRDLLRILNETIHRGTLGFSLNL
jgi:hypothetical protein